MLLSPGNEEWYILREHFTQGRDLQIMDVGRGGTLVKRANGPLLKTSFNNTSVTSMSFHCSFSQSHFQVKEPIHNGNDRK